MYQPLNSYYLSRSLGHHDQTQGRLVIWSSTHNGASRRINSLGVKSQSSSASGGKFGERNLPNGSVFLGGRVGVDFYGDKKYTNMIFM